MQDKEEIGRFRANLQGEVDGAAVYSALADSEADPKLAEVFRRLSAVEQAHGEFWRGRMKAKGAEVKLKPTARARVLSWLARRFGPAFVLPALAASEARDSGAYDNQSDARGAVVVHLVQRLVRESAVTTLEPSAVKLHRSHVTLSPFSS